MDKSFKLLDYNQLAELLGVSRSTILRYDSDGVIPPPTIIEPNSKRWNTFDLELWVLWDRPKRSIYTVWADQSWQYLAMKLKFVMQKLCGKGYDHEEFLKTINEIWSDYSENERLVLIRRAEQMFVLRAERIISRGISESVSFIQTEN